MALTVQELDHLLGAAGFGLKFYPGPDGDKYRAWVASAQANETVISELEPIIEDAIKVNTPIAQRVIAVMKKHAK